MGGNQFVTFFPDSYTMDFEHKPILHEKDTALRKTKNVEYQTFC